MANQEHLDILKQGVAVWNRWRQVHPKIPPDLSEADLEEVNLSGINLAGTYTGPSNLCLPFPGIRIVPTTLRSANLRKADLRKANLRGANLSRVDLREADLRGADLSEGDFNGDLNVFLPMDGATLVEANLTGANLSGADLSGTVLSGTIFAHVDLRSIKGLGQLRHRGPSIVQLHTVQLPQDESRLHFLRGTGLPDEWIDFYRASTMHPILYYSCFISYSSKDQDFAKRLYADLQSNNVRCWFAPHDLKAGDRYRDRIDESIRLYDKLLLILSENAVASTWVEEEVEKAMDKERQLRAQGHKQTVLFPIKLDDTVMQTTKAWAADVRRLWHIGDFIGWHDDVCYQRAFTRLLHDLKSEA